MTKYFNSLEIFIYLLIIYFISCSIALRRGDRFFEIRSTRVNRVAHLLNAICICIKVRFFPESTTLDLSSTAIRRTIYYWDSRILAVILGGRKTRRHGSNVGTRRWKEMNTLSRNGKFQFDTACTRFPHARFAISARTRVLVLWHTFPGTDGWAMYHYIAGISLRFVVHFHSMLR